MHSYKQEQYIVFIKYIILNIKIKFSLKNSWRFIKIFLAFLKILHLLAKFLEFDFIDEKIIIK